VKEFFTPEAPVPIATPGSSIVEEAATDAPISTPSGSIAESGIRYTDPSIPPPPDPLDPSTEYISVATPNPPSEKKGLLAKVKEALLPGEPAPPPPQPSPPVEEKTLLEKMDDVLSPHPEPPVVEKKSLIAKILAPASVEEEEKKKGILEKVKEALTPSHATPTAPLEEETVTVTTTNEPPTTSTTTPTSTTVSSSDVLLPAETGTIKERLKDLEEDPEGLGSTEGKDEVPSHVSLSTTSPTSTYKPTREEEEAWETGREELEIPSSYVTGAVDFADRVQSTTPASALNDRPWHSVAERTPLALDLSERLVHEVFLRHTREQPPLTTVTTAITSTSPPTATNPTPTITTTTVTTSAPTSAVSLEAETRRTAIHSNATQYNEGYLVYGSPDELMDPSGRLISFPPLSTTRHHC